MITFSHMIKVIKKFQCHIMAGLRDPEWRMVYNRRILDNKKTAIGLQDSENEWLENLAEEFNSKPF